MDWVLILRVLYKSLLYSGWEEYGRINFGIVGIFVYSFLPCSLGTYLFDYSCRVWRVLSATTRCIGAFSFCMLLLFRSTISSSLPQSWGLSCHSTLQVVSLPPLTPSHSFDGLFSLTSFIISNQVFLRGCFFCGDPLLPSIFVSFRTVCLDLLPFNQGPYIGCPDFSSDIWTFLLNLYVVCPSMPRP